MIYRRIFINIVIKIRHLKSTNLMSNCIKMKIGNNVFNAFLYSNFFIAKLIF